MTNIEQKALALAIEVREDARMRLCPDPTLLFGNWEALCRAIEQHEAFRQEVSDAVEEIAKAWGTADPAWGYLRRFIIAKPDPLVEAMRYITAFDDAKAAEQLRAELAKRGLEIRKINK